jgi:long-chain fatty acid transport protein
MKSTLARILAIALAVVLLPAAASATNGYFTHGVGLKAKAMGGASLAYPQDALIAGTNPAGMAFIGDRFDIGVDLFRPDRGSEVVGHPQADGAYDANDTENFFMPELGYSRTVGENLTLGLSVYGHGGMNTSYTTPIPLFDGRPSGAENAGVDLAQMFIVPSVAMKLSDDHAVGLGVNVVWQRFKAEGLFNFTAVDSTGMPMFSSDPENLTDNDYSSATGFGVRAGWLGHFGDMLAVGASYQSRTFMSEFEEYAGLFAEAGDFDIPTNYGVGIALMPAEGLVIAADVTQTLYSEINSVANPLLPNLFQSPLGTDDGAGFGWEDVTVVKVGAAYDVMPGLTLRGGYNYGGQPIPADETLFNMIAPGVVEHHITFGGTYAVSQSVEVTFAYMHAMENTVEGEDSIPAPFGGGNADLTMSQNSFGLGVGMVF